MPSLGDIYYGVSPHSAQANLTVNFRSRILAGEPPGSHELTGSELKQVYRFFDSQGQWCRDELQLFEAEPPPNGLPLIRPFLRLGERLDDAQPLDLIRARTWANIQSMAPKPRGPG
jgi:hypothetical protein